MKKIFNFKIIAFCLSFFIFFSISGCDLAISRGNSSSVTQSNSGSKSPNIDIIEPTFVDDDDKVSLTTENRSYIWGVTTINLIWHNKTGETMTILPDYDLLKYNGRWTVCESRIIEPNCEESYDKESEGNCIIQVCLLAPYSQMIQSYNITDYYAITEGLYRLYGKCETEDNLLHAVAEFKVSKTYDDSRDPLRYDGLFEEYGISVSAYLWNNLEPPVDPNQPTEGVVEIFSEKTIVKPIRITGILTVKNVKYEVKVLLSYGQYRMVLENFLEGNYSLTLTIQIGDEYQTVVLEGTIVNAY